MSRLQSQLQPPRQRKKVKGMPTLGAAAFQNMPVASGVNQGQLTQLPTAMSGGFQQLDRASLPSPFNITTDQIRAQSSAADLAGGYMPSPFRQQMSQSAQVQGMIPQYQGQMDVDRGLQYGLPGGMGNAIAPENQLAMLDLIQNQAGRQASVEGLRSQIGREPSGMPMPPRDVAANSNMAQGTPWQPVPGAIGLPTLGTPEEQIAAMQAERAANLASERSNYEDFMTQAQQSGKSYASYFDPENKVNAKPDRGLALEAIRKNAANTERYPGGQSRSQGKLQAQRAANYGRSRGLPPGIATAGIQGLDLLAGGSPESVLSESQRAGAGLPALPEMVPNPELAAIANILSNAPDPAGAMAAIGMTGLPPAFVRPGASGNAPTTAQPQGPTPEEAEAIRSGGPEAAAEIGMRNDALAGLDGDPRITPVTGEAVKVAVAEGDRQGAFNLLVGAGLTSDEANRFLELTGLMPSVGEGGSYWTDPNVGTFFGGA